MSTLAALQTLFQAHVLHGTSDIRELIEEGPRDRLDERLAIYADGYRSRLIEAFAPEFETLHTVMGDDLFDNACRQYVEVTPSTFRNLRWYGATLSDFLATTAPWTQHPVLAEIARFEWTLTLAFDAPDAPVITFDDLAQLPLEAWGSLAFQLHPSAHFIELAHNTATLRKAVDADREMPAPTPAEEPVTWLVSRRDLSVHYRSLSAAETWALQAASEGRTFPEICEGIYQWFAAEEAPAQAATWLRTWVEEQVVSGIDH